MLGSYKNLYIWICANVQDIFRKYPNKYESIISTLCENLDTLDEPEARLVSRLRMECHIVCALFLA